MNEYVAHDQTMQSIQMAKMKGQYIATSRFMPFAGFAAFMKREKKTKRNNQLYTL